ncbi:MAG TPA: hypothetical protein VMY41_10940 [Thermohalobaculum sp.]|nr:hypothetical protein [Thermohalobaculum sp.]
MGRFSVLRIASLISGSCRRVFGVRFDTSAIQNIDSLADFIQTRSAYVAQTSLYGYLKTRMGTRFREVFDDDKFLPSINKAKWRTYGACLSDLTVFAAAITGSENRLSDIEVSDLAHRCFSASVQQTFNDAEAADVRAEVVDSFNARIKQTLWPNAAIGENAFTSSPMVLLESAPIADEFKAQDAEIVTNSIRFRWRDIREQLRKRIDCDAICAEWQAVER